MTDEGKFSDSDKRIILFELQKTFKSKITVCNKIARTMITNRSRRNSSGRSISNDHNHDDDNSNYVGDYNDDGDIDANNNDNNQMTTMMLIQNNILYYFYYDSFSMTNQIILNYKANRDDDHDDFNINKYIRIIYSIILLILLFMMIGYLFYFVLFLIRTSLYQQQIYIYSFCISMIIDSFMIQLIIIMFYDIILPLIIMKEVHRIKEILLDCMIIQKNRNDNKNIYHNHDDNNNLKSQRSSRITSPTAVNQSGFNTANYYYISRLLAKEFESFNESKLISIYHTTNPMISSRITKKATDKEYYKHHNQYSLYYCIVGFYIITIVISNILSSVMLLFLQSPKFLQEFIIQSSASIIISMAIIVTLNYYHIYKFYSFIPLIVLTIIMILWVRFTAYYDYMRRFKLYQHLAVLLNVQHLFREQSNLQIVNDGNISMRRSVLSSGGSGGIIMNQERSRAHHTKKVNNVQSDNYDIYKDNEDSDSISNEGDSIDDNSYYNNNDYADVVNDHDDNNNLKSQRSSRITSPTAVNQSGFNTANYYYISRLLAKEFESFNESKLISIYHTTNPMISSRITKKATDKEYYKHHNQYSLYYCIVGFYIITIVISNILSSVMLLFLQSPKFLQEFIIQSSASIIISMAIIVTLNYYHIYKFYSFIPLIVLTIIMILWVRFTAYYDYMRRFKLYQHLAVLLNIQHLFREQSNLQIVNDGNIFDYILRITITIII